MKKFLIQLCFISLLLLAADVAWNKLTEAALHIPHAGWIVLFFFLASSGFHYLSLRSAKGRPQDFIRFYMGATVLRIFIYLAIILAYRYIDPQTVKPFALAFLTHYVLFTIFEVPSLLKGLKSA